MKPAKQGLVLFVYLFLLLLAVPWYWPASDHRQVAGFPLWVLMTLFIAFCASLLTVWNLMSTTDEEDPEN